MSSDYQSQIVDLRSDTVTRPSPAMLQALVSAPLGDDVLGDDPTVLRLEEIAAERLGHEAAVFVPSGTMGNQIAIATWTKPGDVMLVEEEAHVVYYEVGAPAVLNGVMTRTLPSSQGAIQPATIEKAIMKRSLHTPGSTLLCIENTHNRAGGTIIPTELHGKYRAICDQYGMRLHLDGARVFNAAVASSVPVSTLTAPYDSVSFCLSKGLGAPVGSVLTGTKAFIEEARIWRKRLGGGMRQSGLLAACGIVALHQNVDRLAEDHDRARRFAEAIADAPGTTVDWDTVQTNMVLVSTVSPAETILSKLAENDVWALSPGANRIRFVFHADINDMKFDRAVAAYIEAAETMISRV